MKGQKQMSKENESIILALKELLYMAEHCQRAEIAPNTETLSAGYVQGVCQKALESVKEGK